MSSLKRPTIPNDWESYPDGRRRRHWEHISQMESEEYGEPCMTPCQMCAAHSVQCRRYKPGVCDAVTACSFCKARSVSCSHSPSKTDTAKSSNRRTSGASRPSETPDGLHIQQFNPMTSPRGTPNMSAPPMPTALMFTPSPVAPPAPSASPQLLDTCVSRLLKLQERMLQFQNDMRSPTPDMDALLKEQRAQSAEVAQLMAILLAERAK